MQLEDYFLSEIPTLLLTYHKILFFLFERDSINVSLDNRRKVKIS